MEDIKETKDDMVVENSEINEEITDKTEVDRVKENKVVCEKCGKVYEEPQKFCAECGHEIGTPIVIPKYYCKHCGAEYPKGQKFCAACGEKIEVDILTEIKSFLKRMTDNKYRKIQIIVGVVVLIVGCAIFASNFTESGKTKKTSILKINDVDLGKVYEEYCDSEFAEIGDDSSYIKITCNYEEQTVYVFESSLKAIKKVNEALGLPAAVYTRMEETRAIDGKQSESHDFVNVSWWYDGNNGMTVLYEKN